MIDKFSKQEKSVEQKENDFMKNSHCSVLIKLTDDKKDLLVGHTSWFSYYTMLRTYKFYDFGHYKLEFSAYPGLLYSYDDFYVLSHSKLLVMETTNDLFNTDLFKLIKP